MPATTTDLYLKKLYETAQDVCRFFIYPFEDDDSYTAKVVTSGQLVIYCFVAYAFGKFIWYLKEEYSYRKKCMNALNKQKIN